MERLLRVVTYNVHGFKGCDFRVIPERALAVLRSIDADCIAMQEFVDAALPSGQCMLEHWAAALGMKGVFAPAFERGGEVFGNALLSRFDIVEECTHALAITGYRRRAFLGVVLDAGVPVHVTVVHLGVSGTERARMAERILAMTDAARGEVQVWAGDFNEWRPSAVISKALVSRFDASARLATFPAPAPMLALDRIWVRPAGLLAGLRVHRLAPARWASDHLPLVAAVALPRPVC
jgi:endonuclease/exonuclease/phosphatase family metal-dependent hydrolase